MRNADIVNAFGNKLYLELDAKVTVLAFEGTVISFLFCKDEKHPVAVAKMAARPELNQQLKTEYQHLLSAGAMHGPAGAVIAPKGLGEGEWRNHYFFLQEYIGGPMLSSVTELDPQWWKNPEKLAQMDKMCDLLLDFQNSTCSGNGEIGSFGLAEDLASYRQAFAPDASEDQVLIELEGCLQKLSHVPVAQVACHGDFSANNVLQSEKGLQVLDWRYYLDRYHPILDASVMCFAFLGSYEGSRWYPVWEGKGGGGGLIETAALFLRKVARHWNINPEVALKLVLLSCVSLAVRGIRDGNGVRSRDEGWRSSFLWLAHSGAIVF